MKILFAILHTYASMHKSHLIVYINFSWDISIVFCTVYTVSSRLAWAVFPFTIVAICGVGLTKRGIKILTVWENSKFRKKSSFRSMSNKSQGGSTSSLGSRASKSKSVEIVEDTEEGEIGEGEGLTKIQKGALAFVWGASLIYACLTDKVLSKVQTDQVICSVREDLSDKFNILSVLMIIGLPILCLIMWPLGHLLLDLLSCVKGIVIMSANPTSGEPEANCCGGDDSDTCIETILVFGFTVIFLVVYPTSMLITEFYFSTIETMFPFMLLKYCLGSMHLVLSPACVLIIKRDIRKASKDIYMKRVAKVEETADITIKELQERLERLRAMGNVRFFFRFYKKAI